MLMDHVLTITAHGVEVSGGDNPYDTQSYVKAQRMADVLASMLRNAGGTMTTVAHSKENMPGTQKELQMLCLIWV